MTAKPDDLDAVRDIVKVLEPFDDPERDRIIRWVREKLGMQSQEQQVSARTPAGSVQASDVSSSANIRSFVDARQPKSMSELIATVAYYYNVEATAERKEAINKDDLVDACRKTGRQRPARPDQALVNACEGGVIDRVGTGRYRINAVGENLVAIQLGKGSVERANETAQKKRSPKR